MNYLVPQVFSDLPHDSDRSNAKSRQVLVTGGAGFLGSHLCDRLLRRGDAVVCLDNLQTGRLRNIEHLRANDAFRLVVQDIIHTVDVEAGTIFNLACPASPPQYQLDPVHTLKTSVIGSLNVLDLALRRKARIFHASTSEVYGEPAVHPQPESYRGNVNSFGPRACYDEGKRAAETLFYDYSRRHGADIRIARIFNTYGPRMRMDDGRVVSNFIVQALKGENITIYGDGSQTRSFCYVDDLIDGILLLTNGGESPASPVNLGNPREITIRELADKVIAQTGSRSKIVHRPLPVDDPSQRRPDIGLAQGSLGWTPTVQLDEGLRRTIAYFDEELGEPAAAPREFAL